MSFHAADILFRTDHFGFKPRGSRYYRAPELIFGATDYGFAWAHKGNVSREKNAAVIALDKTLATH